MNKKSTKRPRLWTIITMLVWGCLFIALPVLAADTGTGDGSGGGKNIPLGLDSSSPADGQKDVSLTGDIKLTFNKNVIYLLIRDANKTCFSLLTADGSKVPIEVIMADDQTPEGFEQRRDISIRPLQKLQPGTSYAVKVSPELQAKNGMSLGHEVTVNFVTAGTVAKPAEPATGADSGKTQPDTVQPAPSQTSAPIIQGSDSVQPASEKTTSVEDKTPVETEKVAVSHSGEQAAGDKLPAPENKKPDQGVNRTNALVVALVLAACMGYIIRKKNRK